MDIQSGILNWKSRQLIAEKSIFNRENEYYKISRRANSITRQKY